MNIVYWFTFTDRVKNKTPPYYYIGSKHDCTFVNGIIFDNRNIEYWSSCEQERFLNAISLQKPDVKILHVCDNALDEEEFYHKHYDVAKSELFYNLSTASGKFGGSGENAPRFGKKNSEHHCKRISELLTDVPKTEEHKKLISNGLHRYYENGDRINNTRGKQVLKTWSDGAKKRHQTQPHPCGMKGKTMPRKNCPVCGKSISVNAIARHTNNCLNKIKVK